MLNPYADSTPSTLTGAMLPTFHMFDAPFVQPFVNHGGAMVAPRATQRSATPTFGIDTALTTPTWGWFSVPGATLRARPNHGMNSAGRLFRLLLPPLDDLDRPRQCSTVAPRQREVYLDHALRLSQVGGSRSVLIVATNFRLRPYHHKPRSGVGQFRRMLYSYRVEYLRWIFCQCHDMQDRKSFFGRGI